MIGTKLLNGALAGSIATAPMTLVMEVLYRLLPAQERYPLPPSEITTELTEEAGVAKKLDQGEHTALTLVNHFGYGAGAGSLYALLAGRLHALLPLPGPVLGIGYGLIVWSVSYLGLLPALGILRPATEHPGRRNLLMIAAHVVWGAVTGMLVERLQQRG